MNYSDVISETVAVALAIRKSNQARFAREIGVKQSYINSRMRGRNPWTLRDLDVLAAHGITIPPYSQPDEGVEH